MHFDLQFIKTYIQAHGFMAGLITGPILIMLVSRMLPALTKGIISMTARIIPPIVAWVKFGMVWMLTFPIAKALIVANKDAIKKLLDAIVAALDAIILAVDTAIDDAIDAAAQPTPIPAEPAGNATPAKTPSAASSNGNATGTPCPPDSAPQPPKAGA